MLAQPSIQGTVYVYPPFESKFIQPIEVVVWVPANYDTARDYAVLYMHDGQNLFDSTITWNRQEWGVDETLSALIDGKRVRPCIVVGIFNQGTKRLAQYFPQKVYESMSPAGKDSIKMRFTGRGIPFEPIYSDAYLKFIVEELKPFVDSSFSTIPDASNTFVAGSSFGGLISMYAMCEYPNVFGGAACLSSHWPGTQSNKCPEIPEACLQYIDKNTPDPRTHNFYFDYGTLELDSLYEDYQLAVDSVLRKNGYGPEQLTTQKFEGHKHEEYYWRQRFDIPATYLLKPND